MTVTSRFFRRPGASWILAAALLACVLGFYRPSSTAPKEPFANPVEQRAEMIAELKEISALLREQNALLRSGKVTVVVDDGK